MVIRAVHRLPLRDVVSRGDGPQATCLATEFKKNLDELSPRIQGFLMRLMRYMYTVAYVPGKSLVTADALSPASQERPLTEAEELLMDEVTAQANLVVGGYLQQRSVWPRSELDNSKTTCVNRLCATVQRVGQATHPCHRC